MKDHCPNCRSRSDIITCQRCYNVYCESCQPYWDYENNLCGHCQEVEETSAAKENVLTDRMRRWFSEPAPRPEPPSLASQLPWSTAGTQLLAGGEVVATFNHQADAEWAANAANHHHQLAGAVAMIYNRIRDGGGYFTGSKEDCLLWQELLGVRKDL